MSNPPRRSEEAPPRAAESRRGFVLQPSYRVQGGKPVVLIHGVLESGETFLVRDDRQRPHFHILERDLDRARAIGVHGRVEDPPRFTMRGERVARIELAVPGDVPGVRARLGDEGIKCYEADVRFAYRYLIERGVRGALEITGEPAAPEPGVGIVFDNPIVRPADWSVQLRVLSFDIETDPEARRVLSIALWGCGAEDVLLLTPPGFECPPDATPCATEADLLAAFACRVRELDPDVLTGWNVVDFDLTVLKRRAQAHQMMLEIGRGPGDLRIRPTSNFRGSALAQVPGRVILDGIDLMRGAFVRMESYALDAVAREILGEGKTMKGPGRADEILAAFKEDRAGLVTYNRTDARLVLEILDRLQLFKLSVERSRLTGMPPDRVGASIASFDFLYLSELGRRRLVAPSVGASETSPIHAAGGTVLEPAPGYYRNVLVFDFKSLYPSLIRTFQIDPLGFVANPEPGEDLIRAPNGASFKREPGILPRMLDELFPRREEAKLAGDKVASQAIKILMNSFYGVLGTPACRFADPSLANAITGFGREVLLWSKARIEAKGHGVLYGDTDSLFVEAGVEDEALARDTGVRLVAALNRELSAHVRKTWGVESRLELEFERLYLRLVLPAVRGGATGARKRYAGLVRSDLGTEVVFTGLEVVRRDWTELAKQVQRELYTRLFNDRPVEEYLRKTVADLRSGRHDELLVYRKALRKDLGDYTAATPPHVTAARKMSGRPGGIISYLITADGPEPASEQHAPIDHEHYVQKQVRPVTEPVLAVLGLDFDRVVGDDNQLQLF